MPCYAPNKTKWFLDELVFLKQNYKTLNNDELLQHINSNRAKKIKLSAMRHQLTRMNCHRMKQPRPWTKKEEQQLRAWVPLMGDREIAKYLNEISKRARNFTRKSVSKKRIMLDLHRTPAQLARLVENCRIMKVYVTVNKSWNTIHRGMRDGTRKFTKKKKIHFNVYEFQKTT